MAQQVIAANTTLELVLVDEGQTDYHFIQEAGSILRIHLINFVSAKNNIIVEQNGKNCRTEIYALALVRGEDEVSTQTHVYHNVGEGYSHQLVKYVLADKSRGEFYGELKIAPDAQHTEAYQTNRNILLSESAIMRTRPQLEIYADDVKASHGATTGQLDESSLFYMQQRCIGKEQGRRLLLQAFMADVVDSIGDENKRNQLLDTIDSIIQ